MYIVENCRLPAKFYEQNDDFIKRMKQTERKRIYASCISTYA